MPKPSLAQVTEQLKHITEREYIQSMLLVDMVRGDVKWFRRGEIFNWNFSSKGWGWRSGPYQGAGRWQGQCLGYAVRRYEEVGR